MKVKTFLKIEMEGGKTIKPSHSGSAGITITLDASKKPAEIFIEYFGTDEMMTTMAGDLLVMLHDRIPGAAQNAIKNYLEATNQVTKDGKMAHIKYEKKRGVDENAG